MSKGVLIIGLFFCFLKSYPQAGKLDVTFGDRGVTYTNIINTNISYAAINATAIQTDGKVVVAGITTAPSAIFRYNTDGSPDISFDLDGMVFCYGIKVYALAIQSDGKIIVAGCRENSDNTVDFALARYNRNGSLDSSFDGDGKLATPIGSAQYDVVNAIAIQSDGRIVVAGYSYNANYNAEFALARYNTNGSLDVSFDVDGKLTAAFGLTDNRVTAIAIQSDGKIVAAGYTTNGNKTDFALIRFNSNGSPDNSFDSDGKVTTTIGPYGDVATAIAIQTDGKITASGFSLNTGIVYFAVVRYNTDGSLDGNFDSDGKVTTSIGGYDDDATSMAIQTDGKIVVAGYSRTQHNCDFAAIRYNTDGSLDTSFDIDGILTTEMGSSGERANSMIIQTDGKIILAGGGVYGPPVYIDFAIARYNPDGSLDTGFNVDGKLALRIGSSIDAATSMAIQSDGKIVVAGYSFNGTYTDFALARYNVDGSLDASFDGDGKLTISLSTMDDRARSIAIQTNGKIVVAGYSQISLNDFGDFALVRFNADGSLDSSFDGDGKLTTSIGTGTDQVNAISIQSDGKIVVAGYSYNGINSDFALARYNVDGSLDASFDGDGKLTADMGSVNDRVNAIAIQSDGKIVVAGYREISSDQDFAVVRFNADGSLDITFDGDGKLITAFGSAYDEAKAIAIQSDGKIVVAGSSGVYYFTLARYNNNGSLDVNFDGDGKVTTAFGSSYCSGNAVSIQSNGKILVAGNSYDYGNGGNPDFALARYNTNGSLDAGFDNDGKVILDLFNGSYQNATSMVLRNDRIYVAGTIETEGNNDFGVVAILNDAFPLPLSFLNFSGRLINNDGVLNWKTENEVNTREFIIERSSDSRNYIPLGEVSSTNTTGIHQYYFTDPDVTSLRVPVIYYRLKLKDIDGGFTYSGIVALSVEKNKNIILFYPNPVINEANLTITVDKAEQMQVHIIDNNGRKIRQQQLNLQTGSTSLSIDMSKLVKGIYYLELKGDTISETIRFIKQ